MRPLPIKLAVAVVLLAGVAFAAAARDRGVPAANFPKPSLLSPRRAESLADTVANQAAGAVRADASRLSFAAAAADRSAASPEPQSSVAAFWATQKLIRSGDLRILVKDVRRAIDVADSVGRQHGALLANSSANGDARTTQTAALQFRVPSERFAETVAALRTIGEVRGESINTQDVTKDYADLDTRLRVKDETVSRLRSLLATHTAKLGDVLQVEQELARAVTELEQLKGERQFYDRQIALSTLSVSLFEQQVVPPPARFTDPVMAASRRALEVLGTSAAAVVYGIVFIVPWAVLATMLWWVFSLLRPRVTLPAVPTIPRRPG